ncbi:MAG TPA: UDP-glucose/GDP-mannose dehydrogenase family protein [Bryobacteraceae bacterium]|nr:UDP-glucose/GDP-mannose dehydrogenase family protein [Bryobacteraceae bacterium]
MVNTREKMHAQPQMVAVLGLGYVGCVTAACLARLGHTVFGVDRDEIKVSNIQSGTAPFYEPGLDEIVRTEVAAGRLRSTTSTAEAIADADVALICVGTPSERNGNLSLDQLRRVIEDIARCSSKSSKRLVIAIRSTVFPGTCEDVVMPALGEAHNMAVVSNPEFLREGTAVRDFEDPSLIVVGSSDPAAAETVASLYAPLGVECCRVSLRTAELIKYACNAFHAVKISFANEIGTLAGQLGVDGQEVMRTLCQDSRLNISTAYLKPGFAFGGSCLPKDLRALTYRSSRLDLQLPFLESVLISNERHLQRGIEQVLSLPGERIGIFGLAFKENTDDLRESPVVSLLERMIGKGRNVRVFDPHIRMDTIFGSNRHFILNAIPHIARLMEPSLEGLLTWADHIVVAQNPSPAVAGMIEQSRKPVVDLVGCWNRSSCGESAGALATVKC